MQLTLLLILILLTITTHTQTNFTTAYFKIQINNKGYITSMKNVTKAMHQREFSPADKPSPLFSLYDSKKSMYYHPIKASYEKAKQTFRLHFSNGSVATVSLIAHKKYFKLTLLSLSPASGIDGIQWGAYHTSITNLFECYNP